MLDGDFFDLRRLQEARNRYSYVPARLITSTSGAPLISLTDRDLLMNVPDNWQHGGSDVRCKFSSIELDAFHTTLLNSPSAEDLMHGLVSVVFWGNASSAKGREQSRFAFERARRIPEGKNKESPQDRLEIVNHLRRARALLGEKRISEALFEVMHIKHLRMSFGSKVLTFMNPTLAAVYDKRISEFLQRQTAEELRRMFIDTQAPPSNAMKRRQSEVYAQWCRWCATKADALNKTAIQWVDWNGSSHRWRAVDVERALFTLTDDGPSR